VRLSEPVSSRIDHETGEVVITAPCYATMPVGHRLYLAGVVSTRNAEVQFFADYMARLALSRSGRPWGEGVAVKPPEGALLEEIANGCVHPSLVEEPNGNGADQQAGPERSLGERAKAV
jgi:hypothetical protein